MDGLLRFHGSDTLLSQSEYIDSGIGIAVKRQTASALSIDFDHVGFNDFQPGGTSRIITSGNVVAVAPEPSSVATVGIVALFAGGLMLKARKRQAHKMPAA